MSHDVMNIPISQRFHNLPTQHTSREPHVKHVSLWGAFLIKCPQTSYQHTSGVQCIRSIYLLCTTVCCLIYVFGILFMLDRQWYVHREQYLQEPENMIRSPGTGIAGSFVPLEVSAETKQFVCKSSAWFYSLNCLSSSCVPICIQLIKVISSSKSFEPQSVEIVMSMKFLPYQLQYPSSVPRNHMSSVLVHTCNMKMEYGETGQALVFFLS